MQFKFDINAVEVKDLNGTDYREAFQSQTGLPFEKVIGNYLFTNASDIDISDKAKDIHKGEAINITEREKPMFVAIIENSTYLPIIKRSIINQILPINE